MADNPDIVCSKKNRKARSTNFSLTEIEIIKNQVKLHPILEAKHSNTVTNAKKQAIWLEIVRKVNAVGVAKRSLTEVKDKWRNMCREAKLKFTENRRQMTKTGGGPPPTPLSQTMQDVVDMYRDASSFHGIEGGIETSMPGCSVLSSMAASPTQTVTKDQHDMDIWQDACEDLPVPSQSPISASQAFIVMETPLEEPLSPPSPPKQPSSSLPSCSRDTRQYPYQGKEKEKRKCGKKSVEDVYRLQCEVLEEEKEKIKKEKEKLDLQIQLLHSILKKQDYDQTELFASFM